MARFLEAYLGEYASGKSENAVNRAVQLAAARRQVSLVDLDLVEPFYTLRPLKRELAQLGVDLVAWDTGETMGLGEAGSILKPAMRWALKRPGDVILDLGYGVEGANILNLVEGARDNPHLKIYVVINIARPMTMTEADILAYVKDLGTVHGLINNSHLGDETDCQLVQEGARLVTAVAKKLKIPVLATAAEEKLAAQIGAVDCLGNPVRPLKRYMAKSIW